MKTLTSTRRILIADNDQTASMMIHTYLANREYETDFADDVTDVISMILDNKADVIILDAGFNGGKIFELIGLIKRLAPVVKVILTSGKLPIERVAKARQAGVFFHAAKPFNFEELEMAVRQAIKYNGGE